MSKVLSVPRGAKVLSASPSLAQRFAWSALVLSCFILARPYLGINNDAIQYTAQALARLNPEIYRNDIYFRWGSQDQYTVFSPLFAFMVGHLGIGAAHLAVVIASLVAFLAASFALVRTLLPEGLRAFAMVLIALSAGHYGPLRMFRMAEAFVSPRPIAEAGTLLALLLLYRGRRFAALALLGACGLLHPLVGIAGMLYWWIYMALDGGDRRVLLALVLLPCVAALAGMQPFAQLFTFFDAEWFERIYQWHRQLFISQWNAQDWSRVAFDLAALCMAVRLCSGKLRTVFQAAVLTALVAVGLTFLAGDVLHDTLMTNVQPWRALWLVHWFALGAASLVASRLWPEGDAGRLVAGLLLFAFATRGLQTSLGASLLAVAVFAGRANLVVAPRMVNVLVAGLCVGALASWISADHALFASPLFPVGLAEVPMLRVLSRPFPILVAAAAFYWFTLRRDAIRTAVLASAALLVFAICAWDQRPAFARYVDSSTPGQHPFSRIVAPGEQIWWYGESLDGGGSVLMSWILMERASFQSYFQHVGQHFNRETTMELHRRDELVLPFTFQDSLCSLMQSMNPGEAKCQADFEAVQQLCRDAPELDYLSVETDYPGKWIASWRPPVPMGGRSPRFYLYACKSLVAR